MHPFIEELRKVRNELGISQRQVQKDIGLTRNHMTLVETGRSNVAIRTGVLLCDYYGIDVELFLDYKRYMALEAVKRVSKELEITLQYNM